MEHQHRRYSTLDWPTHEELMKAHRLRGKALRDGIVAVVRFLRDLGTSISEPDVHRQTVPIPLVGGTETRGGTGGDQRRRAANSDRVEDVVPRSA
jgi:hypothetical protein